MQCHVHQSTTDSSESLMRAAVDRSRAAWTSPGLALDMGQWSVMAGMNSIPWIMESWNHGMANGPSSVDLTECPSSRASLFGFALPRPVSLMPIPLSIVLDPPLSAQRERVVSSEISAMKRDGLPRSVNEEITAAAAVVCIVGLPQPASRGDRGTTPQTLLFHWWTGRDGATLVVCCRRAQARRIRKCSLC